jgi:hypothetical protein
MTPNLRPARFAINIHNSEPQPDTPAPLHLPIVYVGESARWQYKCVQVALTNDGEPPMRESDLNALGAEGWELVSVLALAEHIMYYFKR